MVPNNLDLILVLQETDCIVDLIQHVAHQMADWDWLRKLQHFVPELQSLRVMDHVQQIVVDCQPVKGLSVDCYMHVYLEDCLKLKIIKK